MLKNSLKKYLIIQILNPIIYLYFIQINLSKRSRLQNSNTDPIISKLISRFVSKYTPLLSLRTVPPPTSLALSKQN